MNEPLRNEPLRFVLLGHPVGHSVSPAIHGAAYRALGAPHRYEVCDCPTPEDVRAAVARLRAREIAGANVTVPWKRLALELSDDADASARATGVANVLSLAEDGRVVASNTDADALADEIAALHPGLLAQERPRQSRAAIIGAGGAAQAAVVACTSLGIASIGVSSRGWLLDVPRDAWKHAAAFRSLGAVAWAWPEQPRDERPDVFRAFVRSCDVIIQATSAGMHGAGPGEAVSDWLPWGELVPGAVAIDVVYNPRVTPFLRAAEAATLRSRGGLGMLVRQAALAMRIWLGQRPGWVEPDLAELTAAAEAALAQRRP